MLFASQNQVLAEYCDVVVVTNYSHEALLSEFAIVSGVCNELQ